MKPHGYLSLINNCSDSISSLPNLTSTREGNNHQIREDTSKSHEAKGKRPGLFGSRTKGKGKVYLIKMGQMESCVKN